MDTSDFFPALLDLASLDGALYGIPRNIDLRLLHYRTDLVDSPPATWDALVAEAKRVTRPPELYGFLFTGMESGLFGTFFELAEAAGARIFPPSLRAQVDNEGGRWALGLLRELYASGAAPRETHRTQSARKARSPPEIEQRSRTPANRKRAGALAPALSRSIWRALIRRP